MHFKVKEGYFLGHQKNLRDFVHSEAKRKIPQILCKLSGKTIFPDSVSWPD